MTLVVTYASYIFLQSVIWFHNKETSNNYKIYPVIHMNEKGHCKNCGDLIGEDGKSSEFCSEQCGVEYRLEHK
jgi:hypothetical protein